jgi:hypothetical protein
MKINEKLGIPDGINKQATDIFNSVISKLRSVEIPDYKNDDDDVFINLGLYDLKFKDLEIKKVPFDIKLNYYDHLEKPVLIGASYANRSSFFNRDGEIRIKQDTKDSQFLLNLAVGDNLTPSDIEEAIIKDLTPAIVAHEIMHLYDVYKKGSASIKSMSQYSSYQKGGFPPIISDFLYLLYYTTSIENRVRPTELYQILLDEGVTKKDFVNFLNKSNMIKTIDKAKNFSLDDYKNKLNNDRIISNFLDDVVKSGYKRIGGDNAEDVLNILFINISNDALGVASDIVKTYVMQNVMKNPADSFFELIGLSGSGSINKHQQVADRNFERILNDYKKYENNPNGFFVNIQKMLNFVGDKMKRKLFKLYDMVPETLNKSESIINWELYTKLNTNSKIHLTVDFGKFKSK